MRLVRAGILYIATDAAKAWSGRQRADYVKRVNMGQLLLSIGCGMLLVGLIGVTVVLFMDIVRYIRNR